MRPLLRFSAGDGARFPDWDELTLGEVGRFRSCKIVNKGQMHEQGDVPFFKVSTLGGTPDTYITRELFLKLKARYAYPKVGSILLSTIGTVGNVVEYRGEEAYFALASIVWLEHDAQVLDAFLKHFYRAVKWPQAKGSVLPFVSRQDLHSVPFARPSLAEQRKIAAFFDAMDAVVEAHEAEVRVWQKYQQCLARKLLSCELRFKSNGGAEFLPWQSVPLGKLASIDARAWAKLSPSDLCSQSDYLLISGSDFHEGKVDFDACRYVCAEKYAEDPRLQVQNNDVLITKDGTLGKVAMLEEMPHRGLLNYGVFRVRAQTPKVLPAYLFYYLRAPMLLQCSKKRGSGGFIKHLNKELMVDFPVALPTPDEQHKIVSALQLIDQVVAVAKAELKAWCTFRKGLRQQMFFAEPEKLTKVAEQATQQIQQQDLEPHLNQALKQALVSNELQSPEQTQLSLKEPLQPCAPLELKQTEELRPQQRLQQTLKPHGLQSPQRHEQTPQPPLKRSTKQHQLQERGSKARSPLLRFRADDGASFPDWDESTLGKVGRFMSCKRVHKRQMQDKGDVPFFKVGTLGGTPDAYISREHFLELKTRSAYPKAGAILLTTSGSVGCVAEYRGEEAYFKCSHIVWLAHDDRVLDAFLKHFYGAVKWPVIKGSVVPFLSNTELHKVPFGRPCIAEQRKIAGFFDVLDEVIAKHEAELAAWQEYKKRLMLSLLRHELRFKSSGDTDLPQWETLPLGPLVYIRARSDELKFGDYTFLTQSDYLLITGTDLKGGRVDFASCRHIRADSYERNRSVQVRNGDVLLTRCGTLGKTAIVEKLPQPATLNFGIFVLRTQSSKLLPRYLYFYLSSLLFTQFLEGKGAGSVIKNLKKSDLVNFTIGLPSLPEQYKIAACLSALDAVIATAESELALWRKLRQGLRQHMFFLRARQEECSHETTIAL